MPLWMFQVSLTLMRQPPQPLPLLHLPPLAVLVLVLEVMALLLVEVEVVEVWGLMMAPVRETQAAEVKVLVQVMMLECMTVAGSRVINKVDKL